MGKYQVETSHGTYEIEADREPTEAEALSYIGGHISSSKDQGPSKEGVLAGDDPYKDVKEGIPLHGSGDQFKEGMKTGDELLSPAVLGVNIPGHEYVGKGVGAILGGARAAGTVFNPVSKILSALPKYAQAIGSAAGGDFRSAGRDLTGANKIETAAKVGSLDSGNKFLDTLVNTQGNVLNEVSENPQILAAAISPESINSLVKGNISGAPATSLESLASKAPEAIGKAGKTIGDLMVKDPEKQIEKFGDTYREILAPQKGEIKNIEIKSGKDLNDSYKLAAKEGLVLEKGVDGKLDTRSAIEQLQGKIEPIEQELSDSLASRPQKQFNIEELGEEAKSRMRGQFNNDANYESALAQVDKEVNAIRKFRGDEISGSELNQIKSGMWKKGFDAMAPNSHVVARVIGNVAKEAIEDAYKGDADIQGLNSKLGDYLTLQKVLENAHGRVISRGKIGKYASQVIGGIAGHSLGLPVVGELGGGWLGGKVNDFLTDPARLTGRMAKKVNAMGLEEPSYQGKNIEQVAKDLTAKAQMQRLADALKSEEYRKQLLEDSSQNLTPETGASEKSSIPEDVQGSEDLLTERSRNDILKDSASDLIPTGSKLKTAKPVKLNEDQLISYINRLNLEKSVKSLTEQAQKQRAADALKSQEYKKELLEEAAKNMNPQVLKSLNIDIPEVDLQTSVIDQLRKAKQQKLLQEYIQSLGLE